jgi:Gpi18-like mannosyltransferase
MERERMENKMKVPSALQRIPRSVWVAVLIVAAAKVLVFGLGYFAMAPHMSGAPPLSILAEQFNKWDAPHYVYLAQHWYINSGDPANFIVFFPLYPLLTRLFIFSADTVNLSALVVANACSLIALFYLYKLTKLDFGEGTAQKAVLFLSIFPTAYFLSAPYTEGLFFATVIASLYYARIGRWLPAGFLGGLAALTRLGGFLMLPVLAVEFLHQNRRNLRRVFSFDFVWVFLVAVGFLIYLDINLGVTGNLFTFMTVERVHWFNTLDPWGGFMGALSWTQNASYPESVTIGLAPLVFAAFGLVMIVVGLARRFRPSYFVYMLLTWMLAVSTSFWLSVPRYIMAMFPMFMLLGTLAKGKAATVAFTAVFGVFLCYFTFMFGSGQWAF